MNMRVGWLATVAAVVAVVQAAQGAADDARTFGDGRLSVAISPETGFPVSYSVDGQAVVAATDVRQPFVIKENWYAVTNDGTWRVESVVFSTNVLKTVTRAGRWLVGQELTLFPETRRVRRVFTLEWTADVPAKLRGFRVDGGTMALGERGGYRLPCVLPVVDVAARDLRSGVSHETYESPFSVLAADGAGHSVTWAVDDARPYCDTGFTCVTEKRGAIAVTSPFDCQGYARKGVRETVGDLWLCFGAHVTVEAALRDMPKWFETVGQRIVEGRPDWIREGVIYSMHPSGTRGSRWSDWGGFPFATRQVERLADVGIDTIWLLPIESASPYYPYDYYKLAENVGTPADYRAFIAEAKRNGLRLFRDIVPHGGTDTCPRAKEHPEWILRAEDGTSAGLNNNAEADSRYWVFDMGCPAWRDYMSDVAQSYLADGIDGLRLDASGGSPKPNWNPELTGRRASMSRRAAGIKMQRAIREGARRANPEAVTLAEGDLSAFATASDVLYDWSLAFRGLRAFVTADAATVVDGVRRYLNDEQYAQVPGHLRLRYQSNHDCLHSELVYGGAAHLANYALLAWQPGVAFVYQEEEFGHSDALREIYRIRRELPELTRGTPDYIGVKTSPGVYAARFAKDGDTSVVRINFNGVATDGLLPFEYRVERNGRLAFSSAAGAAKGLSLAAGGAELEPVKRSDDGLATWRFPKAKRWCVLTADGRYEESFLVRHPFYDKAQALKPWTYHRAQGDDCQFDTRLHPFGFSPDCAAVAVEDASGATWLATFEAADAVRLLENRDRPDELTVAASGLRGKPAFVRHPWPAKVVPTTGDSRLTAWPATWRFEEGNLRVDLSRGGAIRGVWRRNAAGDWVKTCGVGMPKATAGFGVKQYDALWECEAHVRFAHEGTALRLTFEGELRDRSRFGLPTSALPYAMTYVFDGDASFAVTPSVAITDDVGRNGGLLLFDLERGEADAPAPALSADGFFGRKAKVVEDAKTLFKALWLDREVTALRLHEQNGFTLKLAFEDAAFAPETYVDTRIGTAVGHGSCVLGPCVPHGSVLPGPDTVWPSPSGKRVPPPNGCYPNDPVAGFSQLHCQGTGGTPTYGLFRLVVEANGVSTSRLDVVEARPYYFKGRLADLATTVEMAATENGVLYRLALPDGAKVSVDENCKIGRANARNEQGQFVGNWNPAPYDCYCHWTREGDIVRIAVSFNSQAEAKRFHDAELKRRTLEEVSASAAAAWRDKLARIRVQGADAAERTRFYTHLYHAFVQPRRRGGIWDDHYTVWDTWKTLFPLMELIDPAMAAECVNSFADRMEKTGRCEIAFIQGKEYRTCQGGNDTDNVIADAMLKDLPGLASERLWKVLARHADERTADYRTNGYVAADVKHDYCWRLKSGSGTLGFAYNDACAARVAHKLGKTAEAAALAMRSHSWTNVWNDACKTPDGRFAGFAMGRHADGSFLSNDPRDGYNKSFYEGSSWVYSFNAWHDMPLLMSLCGGREAFVRRLEYALENDLVDFTNEPSFYTPWLFSFADRPDLTAKWAPQVLGRFPADGCPGDDDSGAMGSLYVFLKLGFMPFAGSEGYVWHGTQFDAVEIDLPVAGRALRLQRGQSLPPLFRYRDLLGLAGREEAP